MSKHLQVQRQNYQLLGAFLSANEVSMQGHLRNDVFLTNKYFFFAI